MNKADLSTCQEETSGKPKQPAHAYGLALVARGESPACQSCVWSLTHRYGVADTAPEFMSEECLGLLKPNYLSQIPKQEWIIKI